MREINQKLLDFALKSLLIDKISVIPVGKNKIPLISWKDYQEKFATEEEVRGWFQNFEDPQIGFVTGKISNLLVVDIEKGGDPSFLPQETKIISTGGGGYHYYFLFEEGIKNKARIKKLIDFRGEGGYVVSPNSVSEKGPYEILQEAPLVKFPKESFEELFITPVDAFTLPSKNQFNFDKKAIAPYAGAGSGSRNQEMAKYIGYLLTQIHPADWDTEAWALTRQANMSNTPPLGDRELQTTFESIKRTDRQNNPMGHAKTTFTPTFGYGSTPSKDEPIILGDESDEIKHIAEAADGQELDQDDVYPLQMPCFDEVIYGGVAPGDLVVVAGQTGHGKTTLVQDWTISLIRGEKKPKALWFSYEVLTTHLWKKFQEMGMTRDDCAFIPCKHSTGNVAWVEEKVKEGKEKFGTRLVFIDHLGFLLPKTSSTMGGAKMSTNYSSFLTQIVRDLKTIAIREEVIIFLPVHMRKPERGSRRSDSDDIKDSSGIGQEADLVFLIEREKNKDPEIKSYFTDTTVITLAKNRKTGTTVVGNFNMINGRFAYDDTSDKVDALYESIGKEEPQKVEEPVKSVPFPYKDDADNETEELVDDDGLKDAAEDFFESLSSNN